MSQSSTVDINQSGKTGGMANGSASASSSAMGGDGPGYGPRSAPGRRGSYAEGCSNDTECQAHD